MITVSQEVQHEYRAWDIRNSKMVYDALKLMEVQQLVTVNENYFNDSFAFFDGCKWMMYSGLKDKNGIKIYEGDIIRIWTKPIVGYEYDAVVSWNDGCFEFNVIGKDGISFPFVSLLKHFHQDSEVVGNIYEKPIEGKI